jgi:hypothetical protein
MKNCAAPHQMSRLAYISSFQMAVGKEIGEYNDALFLLSKINLKSRSPLLINASSLNNSAENFQVSQEKEFFMQTVRLVSVTGIRKSMAAEYCLIFRLQATPTSLFTHYIALILIRKFLT